MFSGDARATQYRAVFLLLVSLITLTCRVLVCGIYFNTVKQASKILYVQCIISANTLAMVDLSSCLCKKKKCGHTCFCCYYDTTCTFKNTGNISHWKCQNATVLKEQHCSSKNKGKTQSVSAIFILRIRSHTCCQYNVEGTLPL